MSIFNPKLNQGVSSFVLLVDWLVICKNSKNKGKGQRIIHRSDRGRSRGGVVDYESFSVHSFMNTVSHKCTSMFPANTDICNVAPEIRY